MSSEIEKVVAELRELVAFVSAKNTNADCASKCLGFVVRKGEAVIAALSTPPSSATPGDDVMVPREPTEAMLRALWASGLVPWDAGINYAAMLAAAPQPQERAGSDAGAVACYRVLRNGKPYTTWTNGDAAGFVESQWVDSGCTIERAYTRPQPASDASGGEVQRFGMVSGNFTDRIEPMPAGNYVSYDDYATLSRALAESRDKYRAAMAYADELADKLDTARAVAAQQQENKS